MFSIFFGFVLARKAPRPQSVSNRQKLPALPYENTQEVLQGLSSYFLGAEKAGLTWSKQVLFVLRFLRLLSFFTFQNHFTFFNMFSWMFFESSRAFFLNLPVLFFYYIGCSEFCFGLISSSSSQDIQFTSGGCQLTSPPSQKNTPPQTAKSGSKSVLQLAISLVRAALDELEHQTEHHEPRRLRQREAEGAGRSLAKENRKNNCTLGAKTGHPGGNNGVKS